MKLDKFRSTINLHFKINNLHYKCYVCNTSLIIYCYVWMYDLDIKDNTIQFNKTD